MKVPSMAAITSQKIAENLQYVQVAIAAAVAKRVHKAKQKDPRLVAVSKYKPKELIIAAYNAGQRHFGENYVQELVSKATDTEIIELCKDIKWHFIGHLQRNKIKQIIVLPTLFVMETVDTPQMATSLNDTFDKVYSTNPSKNFNIMVQVNTSEEEEKSGVPVHLAVDLVRHIRESCPRLNFMGLMTIGEFGYDWSKGPNPDFLKLILCRKNVCAYFNIPEEEVELSMGMSDDYEKAIELGSTNVRVGTAIFGQRETKKPQPTAKPQESPKTPDSASSSAVDDLKSKLSITSLE